MKKVHYGSIKQGFKVIRFSNEQVINKTEETINAILTTLKQLPGIKSSNDLSSPFGGQGADFILVPLP